MTNGLIYWLYRLSCWRAVIFGQTNPDLDPALSDAIDGSLDAHGHEPMPEWFEEAFDDGRDI